MYHTFIIIITRKVPILVIIPILVVTICRDSCGVQTLALAPSNTIATILLINISLILVNVATTNDSIITVLNINIILFHVTIVSRSYVRICTVYIRLAAIRGGLHIVFRVRPAATAAKCFK